MTGTKAKPGLRMKELSEASGLPKSTILHYVAEGLLPEPVRTSPNMAYYDPACLERLQMIRQLQSTRNFSLAKIKEVLAAMDEGQEVAAMVELNQVIFGSDVGRTVGLEEFCQLTGLSPAQVEDALAGEILIPLEDDRFDSQDVAMGKLYAQGPIAGQVRAVDISFYARYGRKIVDEEIALRHKLTSDLPYAQDIEMTMAMTRIARATRAYIIDRIFQKKILKRSGLKDDRRDDLCSE